MSSSNTRFRTNDIGSFQKLGDLGDSQVARVDVRTDFMRQLESQIAPLLQALFTDPSQIAQTIGGISGAVPGLQNQNFSNHAPALQQTQGLLDVLLGGNPSGQPSGGFSSQAIGPGRSTPVPQPPTNAQIKLENRQFGGLLDPNAFTIVGEAGPELIPPGNQQVIPLQQQAPVGQGLPPELAPQQPSSPQGQTGFGPNPLLRPNGPVQPQAPIAGPQVGGPGTTGTNPGAPIAVPQGLPGQHQPGDGSGLAQPPGPTDQSQPTFNPGQFTPGTATTQGTGVGGAGQNPVAQTQGLLQGLFSGNPGQGTVDALQPVFNQNLQNALGQLGNQAPSVFNSGIGVAGTDLARQALNDFNLTAQNALQQGVGQQLQGFQGVSGRDLALRQLAQQDQQFASQFGLAQQQQAFNQFTNPTLQLLLSAFGLAQPTGFQTVVSGGG